MLSRTEVVSTKMRRSRAKSCLFGFTCPSSNRLPCENFVQQEYTLLFCGVQSRESKREARSRNKRLCPASLEDEKAAVKAATYHYL